MNKDTSNKSNTSGTANETNPEVEESVTVVVDYANTIFISHPTSSYAVFCFNHSGDFFVNSDWGSFFYIWRNYGKENPFVKFLAQTNTEYLMNKLEMSYREMTNKKLPPHKHKNLSVLVECFIQKLREDIAAGEEWTKK